MISLACLAISVLLLLVHGTNALQHTAANGIYPSLTSPEDPLKEEPASWTSLRESLTSTSSLFLSAKADFDDACSERKHPLPLDIVKSFGAVPDGITDAAPALRAAFASACAQPCSTVLVPFGRFLVHPFTVVGPCRQITFQVNGTLLAPADPSSWPSRLPVAWIIFKRAEGLRVIGPGQLDGQGQEWWARFRARQLTKHRPVGLLFQYSKDISIHDITVKNSPSMHIVLHHSSHATIDGVTLLAPAHSPNTDGIDIRISNAVTVRNSFISVGDDIIAVKHLCSNIVIENITAGSGHGVSMGSLGLRGTVGCIGNVVVRNVAFNGTLTGVRIKTWDGGVGAVRNILFADSTFERVREPIVIDQFYCPHERCVPHAIGVSISNVTFSNLSGSTTGMKRTVSIRCSSEVPCTDISLVSVRVDGGRRRSVCSDAHGMVVSCDGELTEACRLEDGSLSPQQTETRDKSCGFCRQQQQCLLMAAAPPGSRALWPVRCASTFTELLQAVGEELWGQVRMLWSTFGSTLCCFGKSAWSVSQSPLPASGAATE